MLGVPVRRYVAGRWLWAHRQGVAASMPATVAFVEAIAGRPTTSSSRTISAWPTGIQPTDHFVPARFDIRHIPAQLALPLSARDVSCPVGGGGGCVFAPTSNTLSRHGLEHQLPP